MTKLLSGVTVLGWSQPATVRVTPQVRQFSLSPPESLHPVWNPAGGVITDWGAPDHYHHRGIFFAWVYTRWGDLEPDFWNLSKSTGRTRFEAFERLELHREKVLLLVRHVWHGKKGEDWVPVVQERWTVLTYAPANDDPEYWTKGVSLPDPPPSHSPFSSRIGCGLAAMCP